MASLADILRTKSGGMVWDSPHGMQSLPGYGFVGQQPAPPPPQVDPSQFIPVGGIPDGYAMMFDTAPQASPRGGPPGLLDMLMNGSDVPGQIPMPEQQGLLGMLGRMSPPSQMQPGMMGRISGISGKEAPIPMPRPVKPDSITIRKGDTLTSIAKRYGVTVEYLAKKNGIKNANKIRAGATLKL